MAKQKTLQTDFEDEVEGDALEVPAVEKTEDGTPYCTKHHCKMKQSSGGPKGSPIAYFKCPVETCEETGKKVRASVRSVIPSDPQTCPRCESKPVLERDAKLSRGAYTILRCPVCSHKSAPMPRPELVASHERARGAMADQRVGR